MKTLNYRPQGILDKNSFLKLAVAALLVSGCNSPEFTNLAASTPNSASGADPVVIATKPGTPSTPTPVVPSTPVVNPVITPSPTPSVIPTPPVSPSCHAESFTQPDSYHAQDVLIIAQASGSMKSQREAVAQMILDYFRNYPDVINYRLSVMISHRSSSGFGSDANSNAWKYIDNPTEILKAVVPTDSRVFNLWSGGTLNAITSQLTKAVYQSQYQDFPAQGKYFRKDAAPVVLFLSNQTSMCNQLNSAQFGVLSASTLNSVVSAWDPNHPTATITLGTDEVSLAQGTHVAVSRETLAGIIQSHEESAVVFGGLIFENMRLAQSPAGLVSCSGVVNLNNNAGELKLSTDTLRLNYSDSLNNLKIRTNEAVNLIGDYKLGTSSVDAQSISVKVDGVSAEFDFVASTNKVILKKLGQAGSKVEINYCNR